MAARRVPIEELLDAETLASLGDRDGIGPRDLRRVLPRGWVPDQDLRFARRDRRLLFRDGWILLTGLVAFGAAVLGIFWTTFPRGWAGVTRAVLLIAVLLLVGGVVAPAVTRALQKR